MVAVGGALGAGLRYCVFEVGGQSSTNNLLFVLNLAGSFGLGLASVVVGRASLRAFWTVGICGGLTSFSTLALEVAAEVTDGSILWAASYMSLSLAGAVGFVAAGRTVGSKWLRRVNSA